MTDGGADNENESRFLKRWSDRKKLSSQTDVPERTSDEISITSTNAAPKLDSPILEEEVEEERVLTLTDEDMPPLDTLGEASDFGGFLSPGVSDTLRKAALKKLFGLPSCGVLDGLNDYDDDYTVFEPLGDIVTAEMGYRATIDAEREARKAADKIKDKIQEETELDQSCETQPDTDECDVKDEQSNEESDYASLDHEDGGSDFVDGDTAKINNDEQVQ